MLLRGRSILFGSIDLQFHQHLDEIYVACSSARQRRNQLELSKWSYMNATSLVQVLGGKLQTFALPPG